MTLFKHLVLFLATLSFYAQATEPLHDNLPDFDGSVKEYTFNRPGLFGESTRSVFIRREKIDVPGLEANTVDVRASFTSGTGTSWFRSKSSNAERARIALNEIKFSEVSGRDSYSFETGKFTVNNTLNILNGLDFNTAASLGKISEGIYFKLPEAAKIFANMGFNEQRFIVALQSESEAAVLKNNDAIVIVARGTEPTSITNWMTNAKFFQVPLLRGESPRAHWGFAQAAADIYPLVRAEIVSTLENKLRALIAKIKQEPGGIAKLASYGIIDNVQAPDNRPIYITGHSLGGAIATLIYGELSLNWLDTSNMGYYFTDPVLAKIPDENINRLIRETMEAEGFLEAETPRTFSFKEDEDFAFAKNLNHLAVIQNENTFSATPIGSVDGVTIDRRLKALKTFGAPRSMDWLFKYATEKYASVTGSQIIRFENFHIRSGRRAGSLLADLVPRVPLERVGTGAFFPEYTHVGIRASFETDQETGGNAAFIKCAYTNKANEAELSPLADIRFSISYHNMGLYLRRVMSYENSTRNLAQNHSCKNLRYQSPE